MRLIDADALKKALRQRQWHIDDIEEVMKIIDNAPTVTDRTEEVLSLQNTIAKLVEGIAEHERPQGEWVTERKYYDDFLKNIIYECSCSVCGARFPFDQIPETTQDAFYSFNYCPACGAKTRTDAD